MATQNPPGLEGKNFLKSHGILHWMDNADEMTHTGLLMCDKAAQRNVFQRVPLEARRVLHACIRSTETQIEGKLDRDNSIFHKYQYF